MTSLPPDSTDPWPQSNPPNAGQALRVRCPHCHNPIVLVDDRPDEVLCPGCGSSFRLREARHTDTASASRQMGKFQLLERVGVGAFGAVWRARDTELDRIVALKIPHTGLLIDQVELERFHREARAAAQLRHPGIVTVHDVVTLEGLPTIVSDFVAGVPLKDLLEVRRLSFSETADLIAQVADALDYAHGMGLVHRDIKPANIMIERGPVGKVAKPGVIGKPLLLDFGLALRSDAEVTMTLDGHVLGTPAYMSPEQAEGKSHAADRRSDVYSLGVVLYQLLTGELPFRGSRLMILQQVLTEDPRPPRKVKDKVPRDLETVCLKCLRKELEKRYSTAKELAEDLRRFLAGEPVQARPVGRLERGWRWCRRNPVVAGLLAAVFLVLLLGTGVASFFALRADANARRAGEKEREAIKVAGEKEEALEQVKKEAGEKETALQQAREVARELRYNLANSTILAAQGMFQNNNVVLARDMLDSVPTEPEQLRHFEWHYLKRQFEGGICTLYGHTGSVISVAFSPDGTRLATSSGRRLVPSSSGGDTARVWDARTGTLLFELKGYTADVESVAFSPDGTRLATGSKDRMARLWDARTGAMLLEFKGHTADVESVAFSPDGTRLATGSDDRTARVWDARTGAPLLELKGNAGWVMSVAFSPDGARLATGGGGDRLKPGELRLWDARTGALLLELKGNTNWVMAVAFSPDGTRLASGGNAARLWDARTGALLFEVKGHTGWMTSVAFSPDGTRLACGSQDNTARLCDARTGATLLELKGHTGGVESVAFSPDGTRLATGSTDKTARLWDVRTGADLLELKGHAHWLTSVAFSPDGTYLATGSDDRTARLWDARTGALLRQLKGHTGWVESVAFSPDGTRLATGSDDQTVRLWDARTGDLLLDFKAHSAPVMSVAFSPDGTLLATGSQDKLARLWDARTGNLQIQLETSSWVTSVAFSPDGSRLATGGPYSSAKLWDPRTGAALLETKAGALTSGVAIVAFSPDGTRLATAGRFDQTARLWDARTGAALLELKGHTNWVTSIAFSPDSARLVTGSQDQTARVWDARTGATVLELKGHTDSVTSVAFSSDGTRLATASKDRTVRLWDARNGPDMLEFSAHAYRVKCVAFSPDGTRLATGTIDSTVRLWDARTGTLMLELKGHTGSVESVAFSRDGTRLATGSDDRTARLWDARTGAPLFELMGHTSPVRSVAFSPDDTRLAGRSYDTIVWDLKTGKPIEEKPDAAWFQDHTRSADGRRLAVMQDYRVRLVSLELPDPVELARRSWATRFDPYWHREQLQAQRQAGGWFTALYHVNQLLLSQPSGENLLQERRDILAEAVKRDPKDAAALAANARVLLEQGKRDDFLRTCGTLAELAADFQDELLTRRLAAICILAPDALPDLTTLLEAFRKTMSEKYSEDLRLYGGLLLRAGKTEEAVKYLERARNDESGAPCEDLLLALAYERLKRPNDAKAHLDRADFVLDRQPTEAAAFTLQAGCLSPLHAALATQKSMLPNPHERIVGWQGWIELQVLRREAQKALRDRRP